jgi:hypothetical protein
MSSTQTSFLDSLTAAARENPLAAALIGGGALWLLAGSDRVRSLAGSATAAASPLLDTSVQRLRQAAPRFESGSDWQSTNQRNENAWRGAGESLREVKSSASEAMSGMADAARQGVAYARENLGKVGEAFPEDALTKAQSSFADVVERQPLVIGAVGLAIGAAIAGAFRASDLENEWAGELSARTKADLSARAGAVAQSVREASDTLRAEFGDAGSEALDRLRQSGGDALEAAKEAARGPQEKSVDQKETSVDQTATLVR